MGLEGFLSSHGCRKTNSQTQKMLGSIFANALYSAMCICINYHGSVVMIAATEGLFHLFLTLQLKINSVLRKQSSLFIVTYILQFNNLFDYASIKMRVKWIKRTVHYVLWFRLQLRVFSLSYDINVIKHQAALC